jgi:hypothetical protein
VELVSRRDEFQLELLLLTNCRRGKIEVELVSCRDEFQLQLVSRRDEKAISLKCFETVFFCKIVLKIILLNKKNQGILIMSNNGGMAEITHTVCMCFLMHASHWLI